MLTVLVENYNSGVYPLKLHCLTRIMMMTYYKIMYHTLLIQNYSSHFIVQQFYKLQNYMYTPILVEKMQKYKML